MRHVINFNKSIVSISAFILVAACGEINTPASAGEYKIVEGKGVKICVAYEANLNSFQPKVPMVCGRSVNPKMTNFSKPKWSQPRKMPSPSGVSAFRLYMEFGELLWARDANPIRYFPKDKWNQWQSTSAQRNKAYKSYLNNRKARWNQGLRPSFAVLDINNDGEMETVYFEKSCRGVYGELIAVLTSDLSSIDIEKTELITPHPPLKKLGLGVLRPVKTGDWGAGGYRRLGKMPVEDSLHSAHYDLFLYKKHIYIDQWWTNHPAFQGKSDIEAGLLRVFKVMPEVTEEICSYRYTS